MKRCSRTDYLALRIFIGAFSPITVEEKARTAHSAALRELQKSREERPTQSVFDPYFAPNFEVAENLLISEEIIVLSAARHNFLKNVQKFRSFS